MSDATFDRGWTTPPRKEAVALPAPAPVPKDTVFIGDCVTPVGGETLLSLILKRAQGAP